MNTTPRPLSRLLPVLCLLLVIGLWPTRGRADDIRYEGTFEMADNGDCKANIKLSPPMVLYQKLRESVSNLSLVLRNFASSRADTETVNKKADWDDPNHSLTFSMTILGAGRNMGNHWEMLVPKEMEFSNLDEAKRTLYFTYAENGENWTIRGLSRLVLPADAKDMRYDAGRRVASYVLPIPKAPGGVTPLAVAGLVLAGLGLVLTVLSFVLKGGGKAA